MWGQKHIVWFREKKVFAWPLYEVHEWKYLSKMHNKQILITYLMCIVPYDSITTGKFEAFHLHRKGHSYGTVVVTAYFKNLKFWLD